MNESRVFNTGAVRDNADGKGRMDLLPWNAIIELSKHCERGAKHYGENNVRKGIPFHSLADSGARHLAKWIAGIQDEPTHLVAACWNLMWLLEQTITKPELNDMPWAQKVGEVELTSNDSGERIIRVCDDNGVTKDYVINAKDLLKYYPPISEEDFKNMQKSAEHYRLKPQSAFIEEHPDDKADREKKIAESGFFDCLGEAFNSLDDSENKE